MRTIKFVATTVLAWLVLVLAVVMSMIWIAGMIEGLEEGVRVAAWNSLLHMPSVGIRLLPLCVFVAVGLAVARMDHTGERAALWSLGHHPLRTARVPAVLGILVGLAGLSLQHGIVSELERRRIASAWQPENGWVWIDSGALHMEQGIHVRGEHGRASIGRVEELGALRTSDAWIALRPEFRSNATLWDSSARVSLVELQSRFARVFACGLLALWAWLPAPPNSRRRFLVWICMGFGWSLLELVAQGMARAAIVPVSLGVWVPCAGLALLCLYRAFGSRGTIQSKTQT